MKKYGKTFAFLAILIALIYIPGLFMNEKFMVQNHLANGRNGVYAKLAVESKDTLDVIVIGDSESYTTVSPMELWKNYGYTSYAAGKPGAKISDVENVLRTAFKKQHPKVVMLESNVLFRYEPEDAMPQSKVSRAVYRNLPLLKYHDAWKSPFMELRTKTYKGFPISATVKPFSETNVTKHSAWKTVIEDVNREVFTSMKRLCEDNGAQLIIYSAPSPINYSAKKVAAVKTFAKAESVKFLDLNTKDKELDINWKKDTRDQGDHLNVAGAVKTTEYIGKYLSENFEIPNRRDSECAESWDRMLEEYEKNLASAEKKIEKRFMTVDKKGRI